MIRPIVRDRRDWWRCHAAQWRMARFVLWILVRPWRWNDEQAWR